MPPAGRLVDAAELVLPREGCFRQPGRPEVVRRPMGLNDVGMVAWLLTLKTPECPQVGGVGWLGCGSMCVRKCMDGSGC